MPMEPDALGSETADEDSDDGDEDLATPKRPPSGAIVPSESSMRFPADALTAIAMTRRVFMVSNAPYATCKQLWTSSGPGEFLLGAP